MRRKVKILSFHRQFFFVSFENTFSARVAEEKIRYAAYNCLAIDTDVSPWEEWASICTQSTIGAELPDKKRWVLPY